MEHTRAERPTQTVARHMRKIRDNRGLSAAQVAERVTAAGIDGVTWDRQTVTKLETGRRDKISIDEVLALAEALGVPARDLLPAIATSTPLAFKGLSDEQRAAAEANAADAAPALAAEVARLLTEGHPIAPHWRAEATYRLQEALNALVIGQPAGAASLPGDPEAGIPMESLERRDADG